MYESNKEQRSGFGCFGEVVPLTEKSGCSGAYRSRMTPATPGDKFKSSLSGVPEPRSLSNKVRPGRITITKFRGKYLPRRGRPGLQRHARERARVLER